METAQKQHNLLKALIENAFDDEFSNNRLFTAIFRGHETGWWSSHITVDAISQYAANDFKKCDVVRAHVIDRLDTMREIFAMPELLEPIELQKFVHARNRCVIATRAENGCNRFSQLIPLPQGLFPSANVGYKFRKGIEGKALRDVFQSPELGQKYNAQWAVPGAKEAMSKTMLELQGKAIEVTFENGDVLAHLGVRALEKKLGARHLGEMASGKWKRSKDGSFNKITCKTTDIRYAGRLIVSARYV